VEHLLVKVMGLDEGNDVMKALEYFMGEGQVDIYKLTEMTDDQIHEMKFKALKEHFNCYQGVKLLALYPSKHCTGKESGIMTPCQMNS